MNNLLNDLSRLYMYPGREYRVIVADATERAAELGDDVYVPMRRLFDWIGTQHQSALEETFTQTFDLNPTCNPEAGWHIWGEDYNRGAFMADLRDLYAEHDIEETMELPDHMSNLLRLIGANDDTMAQELARHQLLPALAAMRIELASNNSPYELLVAATLAAVKAHTAIEEDIAPPTKIDKTIGMEFTSNIGDLRKGAKHG